MCGDVDSAKMRTDLPALDIVEHRGGRSAQPDGRTEVVTQQTNVPAAYLSAEAQAGFATSLDRCASYVAGLST